MRLRCYLGRKVHLIWVGRILAGLYDQPDANVSLDIVDWVGGDHSVAVDMDGTKIAFEMNDQTYIWDEGLLDWCDIYVKRSIDPLWKGLHQEKVIPFGIYLRTRSRRSALSVVAALARAYPAGARQSPRDLYNYLVSPVWQDYEYSPSMPVEETILYQTRVWEPSEAPDDEIINTERVDVLRALKREFKDRCVGGLVATKYAQEHFPELITSTPTRQPQYVRWAKRPAIGIYSRGLFGAIAIKMAEFLAASKCIVSDPIRNVLPAPLDHILEYRSPEECVAHCATLLSDPGARAAQREASWEYYNTYVQTPNSIRRILDIARDWK